MTRAFLALEVRPAVKERLAAAQENLRRELPRARWTRPDGWHLTLKFLGEVAAPVLDPPGTPSTTRTETMKGSTRPRPAGVSGRVVRTVEPRARKSAAPSPSW